MTLTPEQFRKVEQLFHQAAGWPDSERDARLRDADAETAVIERVARMLRSDAASDPLLDQPFPVATAIIDELGSDRGMPTVSGSLPHPEQIGEYRILEVLGHGGMGIVYLAEQARPRRMVALKVIPRLAARDLHRRFEREAQVLGALHHSNIAQVYEAGAALTEDGERAFIAMELVKGTCITDYAQHHQLDDARRLGMIATICDAVNHAHQRGVVHRDLKPHNILVLEDGTPKVLDFGVARIVDASDNDSSGTLQTGVGQIIGTIPYMSPEQVEGDPRRIDTRADVYALGVLCFELLTGELPLDLRGRGIVEAIQMLREREPRRLEAISRAYRGDLDTIVGKALEKERDHRYQSAGEFGADIRRFLRHEPIVARPASSFYQMRKFARRHKPLAISALTLLLVILGGGLTSTALYIEADAARRVAAAKEVEARLQEQEASWQAYTSGLAAAEAAIRTGNIADARRQLNAVPVHERHWEWYHLSGRLDDSLRHIPSDKSRAHKLTVKHLLYTADGTRLFSCADEGVVVAWDVVNGTELWRTQTHKHWTHDIALNPDETLIAAASQDGRIVVCDAATGKQVVSLDDYGGPLASVDWSADGATVIACGRKPWAIRWSTETWESERLIETATNANRCMFTPDQRSIIVLELDAVTRIDAATGAVLASQQLDFMETQVGAFDEADPVFVEGGTQFILPTRGGFVVIIDTETCRVLRQWHAHQSRMICSAATEDSRTLLTSGNDGLIRRWELQTGRLTGEYHGHSLGTYCLTMDPSQQTFTSGSRDGTIRVWDIERPGLMVHERNPEAWIYALTFTPDGRSYYTGDNHGAIIQLSEDGRELSRLDLPREPHIWHLDTCLDGDHLLISSQDQPLRIWHPPTGELREIWKATALAEVAVHPDGERALVASHGELVLLNLMTGEGMLLEDEGMSTNTDVASSADGTIGLTGDLDGRIRLWDFETGALIRVLEPAPGGRRITGLAMNHEGTRVAAGDLYGRLTIWDVNGERLVTMDDAHGGEISDLAFSPADDRIHTISYDTTMKVWTAAGRHVVTLYGHTRHVICLAASPDGHTLLTGGSDSHVLRWVAGKRIER